MIFNNISLLATLISLIILLGLGFFILSKKNKKKIHYIFSLTILLLILYATGQMLEIYSYNSTGEINRIYTAIHFIGETFISISVLLTGITFCRYNIKFFSKYLLLLVYPAISYILTMTNDMHHLMYENYSVINSEIVLGKFQNIDSLIHYSFIIIGMAYLLFYAIRSSGFISKQAILIFSGILLPFIAHVLQNSYFFRNTEIPVTLTINATTIGAVFVVIAIFKYNFLNILPIAIKGIINRITDGFLIVSDNNIVLDFNAQIEVLFKNKLEIKKNMMLKSVFYKLDKTLYENLVYSINKLKNNEKNIKTEQSLTLMNKEYWFEIEFSVLKIKEKFIGIIILFKDITMYKKTMELLKYNKQIIVENERLISMGQLIEGIAYNLETPVNSIEKDIKNIKQLIQGYKKLIQNQNKDKAAHMEIMNELFALSDRINPYFSYISDIISSVKGQFQVPQKTDKTFFTVENLIRNIKILLLQTVVNNNCKLNIIKRLSKDYKIKGEINSLTQIIDNIIINSVNSYRGKRGSIDLCFYENEKVLYISITDYSNEVEKSIRKNILKEMVTNEDKASAKIGLYFSNSLIKSQYGGSISNTYNDIKTDFIINIPKKENCFE
jgi:two-component system sensor histidine kinase HupT/HoxJ